MTNNFEKLGSWNIKQEAYAVKLADKENVFINEQYLWDSQ